MLWTNGQTDMVQQSRTLYQLPVLSATKRTSLSWFRRSLHNSFNINTEPTFRKNSSSAAKDKICEPFHRSQQVTIRNDILTLQNAPVNVTVTLSDPRSFVAVHMHV